MYNDENLDGLRIELAEEPYHSQTQIILMEDDFTRYRVILCINSMHCSSEETLGPNKASCYKIELIRLSTR